MRLWLGVCVALLALALLVPGSDAPVALAQAPEPTATRPPVLPIETPTVEPTRTPTPTATPGPVTAAPPAELPASETTVFLPEAGVSMLLNWLVLGVGVLFLSGVLLVQRVKRR